MTSFSVAEDTTKNLTILVGNGLSIAFNEKLNLREITEEVLHRYQNANGSDVVAAIQEIAERALPDGVSSSDDFEQLVGAFGAESRTLGLLRTLADLTQPSDEKLLESIKEVANFAEQVQDTGISYVLEVITERSYGYHHQAENLHSLVRELAGAFKGKVVFGNLNYDTLLLSALLQEWPKDLADMGHGWQQAEVTINEDGVQRTRSVPSLRKTAGDFPTNKRIQLLHLHGSVTFWQSRDGKVHAKIPKELLDGNQWASVRKGSTDVRPTVVLANHRDKASHVTEYPFNLAYEMLSNSLVATHHWLIIGYSFRDEPVNATLRNEFIERPAKPQVLVVTYGETPSRVDIERALGWGVEDGSSEEWLTINTAGANGFEKSDDWLRFKNS